MRRKSTPRGEHAACNGYVAGRVPPRGVLCRSLILRETNNMTLRQVANLLELPPPVDDEAPSRADWFCFARAAFRHPFFHGRSHWVGLLFIVGLLERRHGCRMRAGLELRQSAAQQMVPMAQLSCQRP